MAAGSLACSFCTSVPSAWWMPDVKVAIAASIVTGFVVAVGAAFTSGRREAALNAVAVALLLVLPAAGILEGMGTQVDGVVMAVPVDSDDGAWRVRYTSAFPVPRISRRAAARPRRPGAPHRSRWLSSGD
ncbi:MAG: hypothetical protein JJE52_05460 [Acidimicrobiia bacterium]|nr:hypothetical protein [Acidimicrobiia bacterium]